MFMMMSVIFSLKIEDYVVLISLAIVCNKISKLFLMIVFFVAHLYFSRDSIIYRFRYIFAIVILASFAPFLLSIIEILDQSIKYVH